MSQKKGKTRKIKPSDEELADQISAELESNGADSAASAKGPYAIYDLIKKDKTDWILSPMRVNLIAENMCLKGTITKISADDRRYFQPSRRKEKDRSSEKT